MRPPEAFGRPRPSSAAESDTSLAMHPGAGSSSVGAVVGGAGSCSTAPMMTYFLAEEAEVDAAMDSGAGIGGGNIRSLESVKRHQPGPRPRQQPGRETGAGGDVVGPPHDDDEHHDDRHEGHDGHDDSDAYDDEIRDDDSDDDDDDNPINTSANAARRPATPPQPVSDHDLPLYLAHGDAQPTPGHRPQRSLSPLLSQPTTPSVFAMSGPTSLSALSSPSSRRNSLSSSLMDDTSGHGGDEADEAGTLLHGGFNGGFGGRFGGELGRSGEDRFRGSFGGGSGSLDIGTETTSGASGAHTSEMETTTSHLLEASTLSTASNSMMMDSGSAPQLIMPSIQMPSRRPFTETGKSLGRLKVLIAGDSGLGKTSLIKAIVQSCQHIVHVDHITPPSFSLGTLNTDSGSSSSGRRRSAPASTTAATAGRGGSTIRSRRKARLNKSAVPSTTQISEIYASTKPYPAWWSELDDGRLAQRRKSLGDTVLDRNICFVDTPGYSGNVTPMDMIMPTVQYVEAFLHRLCSNSLSDTDVVGLVSGDGGASIDVVFYLVDGDLKPADVEYLRLLAPLTNIVPLLARADVRSDAEVARAKERIAKQLDGAGIRPFAFHSFGKAGSSLPYAVSSTPGADLDTMDASLLMSPGYVQPLVPTELATLVDQVFSPDGVSRLRHAAARKFAQWRKSACSTAAAAAAAETSGPLHRPQSLYRPLNLDSASPLHPPGLGAATGRPGALALTGALGAPASFALARVTDHTQREEQLAQIRLANWAAELQRTLDNERARYESLARSERAVWLTERLSECVQDGTLVAVTTPDDAARQARSGGSSSSSSSNRNSSNSRHHRKHQKAHTSQKKRRLWPSASITRSTSLSHDDPLGLLEVTAALRARGWLALEVISSLSMLGGLALWMAKHNYHLQVYGWIMRGWTTFWNSDR